MSKQFAIVGGIKTAHKCIAICEVWTYDVWGNARDGFEVNDRSCQSRDTELEATLEISNVPIHPAAKDEYRSFPDSASFSAEVALCFSIPDRALTALFGRGCAVDDSGDGQTFEIVQRSNGRPIGQVIIVGWKAAE